jgi:hypothetical protein
MSNETDCVTVAWLMQKHGLSRKEVDAILLIFKIEKVGTIAPLGGKGKPSNLYNHLTFLNALGIVRVHNRKVDYERTKDPEGTSIVSGL